MVEIGGRPILWHIMKLYAHYGFNDFVIALGYKGDYIKRWMVDYSSLQGDLTVSLKDGEGRGAARASARTGRSSSSTPASTTMTGGRIKRLAPHLGDGTFMLTWGDGVADIDIPRLLEFHRAHGKLATLTAVRPPARFGHLTLGDDDAVERVLREAAARRGLDQRRVLRARAGGLRLHRRRRDAVGARAAGAAGARTAS